MVITGHTIFSRQPPWIYIRSLAHYGVLAFFVLSGYLITTLLLEEHTARGSISLRKFYARRALRIFPLAYVYIFCVFLLTVYHFAEIPRLSFITAITYTSNYNLNSGWLLAHLWSLSVEEQFYLLWPSVFVLIGVAGARRAAALVVLVVPAIRLIVSALFPNSLYSVGGFFPLVADVIAIGGLAAFYRHELLKSLSQSRFRIEILAVMFLSIYFPYHQATVRIIFDSINPTVYSMGFVYCMLWLIANPNSMGARVLNSRPFVAVGTLSYSLYLWQEMFVKQSHPSMLGVFTRTAIIFGVATAAHFIVEKPFLSLKERFASKAATAAP